MISFNSLTDEVVSVVNKREEDWEEEEEDWDVEEY